MRKKAVPNPVLFMTKVKFAITANLLIVFIILHNVISYLIQSREPVFITGFMMTLVYFIASGSYTLYFDVFEK
jgi:hypothetical protein